MQTAIGMAGVGTDNNTHSGGRSQDLADKRVGYFKAVQTEHIQEEMQ